MQGGTGLVDRKARRGEGPGPGEEKGRLLRLASSRKGAGEEGAGLRFSQLHVEMARNATGDFNPFHDPVRWREVRDNRFGAPIVLGFQLEMLLAEAALTQEPPEEAPAYLACRFTFADVVRVGEVVAVEVKPARSGHAARKAASRVLLRREGRTVVTGRVEYTASRPAGLRLDFRPPFDLSELPSGSRLAGGRYFLRHRALQDSDAKNFLAGSLVSPRHYFDELEGRRAFPHLFPLSHISAALLEKAASEGYDFMENPLVYASHLFHLDLGLLRGLEEGAVLHLLVEGPLHGKGGGRHSRYRCVGLLSRGRLLFTAEVRLAPLSR